MRVAAGLNSVFDPEMTLAADFQPVFGAIRGSFWAPNRFLVKSEAHFGLPIDFWCAATLILGFKPVFGQIRGSFWASNQFLVCGDPHFGLQIGFWSNPRVILGFKLVFGQIRGSFWASNRFLVCGDPHFGLPRVIIHPWALLIIQIVRDSFESLPVASINQPSGEYHGAI